MTIDRSSVLLRYGVALAGVALATAGQWMLDPMLGSKVPYPLFFLAIVVAAGFGGFGPALAAVILGGMSADYFLLTPWGSFHFDGSGEGAGLVLFACTGLGIAVLGGSMDAVRRRA
jgi:two-component system sensor histidine kinase/response regulator